MNKSMQRKSTVPSVMALFSASSDPYYQIRAEPLHPMAAEFLGVWRRESRAHEIVVGKDMPTRPFARFLSNLMTVEPVDNDTDCKIRVAGNTLRKRYGQDVTGMRFSELFSPPIAADNLMRLREVRRTGTPIIFDATIIRPDDPVLCYETLLLRILAPDERTYWNVVGIFMLDT